MPATYTAEKSLSRALRRVLDFDPDSGSAVLATLNPAASEKFLSLTLGRRFVFGIMKSVGTGAISAVKVQAATAADGTGAQDFVSATPTTADAVGDTVWYEVDAEQAKEVLAGATHVGLSITLATSTDECVIYAEISEPVFPRTGLTANYIS